MVLHTGHNIYIVSSVQNHIEVKDGIFILNVQKTERTGLHRSCFVSFPKRHDSKKKLYGMSTYSMKYEHK